MEKKTLKILYDDLRAKLRAKIMRIDKTFK